MRENPVLFRKRIIPQECIELKDDKILLINDDIIVTKWNALNPKKNLHHGYSCYYLAKGFKVSKFYREDNTLMYYYCDIVKYDYQTLSNHLIVTDLLADVIIHPDGFIKVIDLDELVTALDNGGIDLYDLKSSIQKLDQLLSLLYKGELEDLTKYITQFE